LQISGGMAELDMSETNSIICWMYATELQVISSYAAKVCAWNVKVRQRAIPAPDVTIRGFNVSEAGRAPRRSWWEAC
jgi:hypothetical protein